VSSFEIPSLNPYLQPPNQSTNQLINQSTISVFRFLLVFDGLVTYKKGMKKNLCVLCASKERSEWAVKFAL